MRRFYVVLAMALATVAAQAEPDYSRVISSVTISFDGGDEGRAVLVSNGDAGADLYVYPLADGPQDASTPAKPMLVKKNIAWSGTMFGTRPSLETNAKGSLLIKSENTGVGRDRWTETIAVVYRNKELVVAGLTRESYDAVEPNGSHSCDLNFLTAKGKRDGKPIDVKSPLKKMADWDEDKAPPKECVF
jgi:hypothetical protein